MNKNKANIHVTFCYSLEQKTQERGTPGQTEVLEVSDFPHSEEINVHTDSWEWLVGCPQKVESFVHRPKERKKSHQWFLT